MGCVYVNVRRPGNVEVQRLSQSASTKRWKTRSLLQSCYVFQSNLDRSVMIPSEPWKNAQPFTSGSFSRMAGSYRYSNRNCELSVLGRDLPPSPPSPSELLGFQSRDEKLLELTNRTGYNIEQRNGQRIYGWELCLNFDLGSISLFLIKSNIFLFNMNIKYSYRILNCWLECGFMFEIIFFGIIRTAIQLVDPWHLALCQRYS